MTRLDWPDHGHPHRRRHRRRARSRCSRHARTPASTIAPATTGRTPTAGRRRPALRWLQRRSRRAPAAQAAAPQPVRGRRRRARFQPVCARLGARRSTRSRADDESRRSIRSRPRRREGPPVWADALPKLRLLARGLAVFGSYAKVLLEDDVPAAYAQFGPLSAYPRALRTRELYPRLPVSPLPAVITCIATTAGGARPGPGGGAGRGGLRRSRRPRVRRRGDVSRGRRRPGRDQRRDPAFWEGWGSPSRRRTSGSRSCAGSSREVATGWRRRGLVLALVLAACGRRRQIEAPSPGAPPRPASGTAARSADPSASGRAPRRRRPHDAPARPVPVREDPSLLAVLPAEVGGIAGGAEPRASPTRRRTRPSRRASRAAVFAVAGDGSDLVSAVVARPVAGRLLRTPSSATGATRTTPGACAQAGGVAGNAETQLGGRTVYIGTCAGGLRTYHAWIDEPGRDRVRALVRGRALGRAAHGGPPALTPRVPGTAPGNVRARA